MARNFNRDIISRKPVYGKRVKADGNRERIGTKIVTADGVEITLLTPSGKGAKYALEMKENKRYTNSGTVKADKRLTEHGRAYRSGYLQARKDSARAHKAKNK